MPTVDIDLVYFDGCPHVDRAREHLKAALASDPDPQPWREWNLSSADTPERFRRYGSPTVLVAGRDVTGDADAGTAALACRLGGAPSVAAIRAALGRPA